MKTQISKLAAIALVTTIGVGTLTTTAYAHDQNRNMGQRHEGGPMQERGMARGGFPLLALGCAPEAAERYETALENVGERLELTEEQTVAFDAFTTAALAAQTSVADTCAAFAEVDSDDDTAPDLIDRLTQRQLMLSAQVEAMDSVLPALEAFYDSLTDEQKAELMPQRGDRGQGFGGMRGFRAGPGAPASN